MATGICEPPAPGARKSGQGIRPGNQVRIRPRRHKPAARSVCARATPMETMTMTATQTDKATTFAALHRRPQPFVIANAWDGGSARILAALGFEAIATSSAASAGTLGRLD